MSPEKEQFVDNPYPCPECGADLGLPGAVIVWIGVPGRSVGHIWPGSDGEEGEEDKVLLILDGVTHDLSPSIECADCYKDLDGLFAIEDVFLKPGCEIKEEDD